MRVILLALCCFAFSLVKAAENIPVISLNPENIGYSLGKQTIYIEDPEHKLSIEDILRDSTLVYKKASNNVENLDFTTSAFWFRFKVKNELPKDILFFLETARPLTNKVVLYQVNNGRVLRKMMNGDNIPYSERAIAHRKILFPIQLTDDNPREFVLYAESDGEVLSMPLIFWKPQQFMESDYFFQFYHGLFYGVLFFVAVIYFFFYIALGERSFLYYVLYVAWMALLQLSLDGMSYQLFFSNSPYWADHFLVLSAGQAVFFVLLFGNSFIKVKENAPKFYSIYKYLIPIIGLICLFSLLPGPQYKIFYPLVNAGTGISTLLTLSTIIYLKVKHKPVDWFFFTAFTTLIVSVIVFILGQFNVIENRVLTDGILKAGTGMEVIFLSLSLARKYRELQEAKEHAQKELLLQLEETNKLTSEINVRLEIQVEQRTREIRHQKAELEEKNKEILSSINYARRIQYAILPSEQIIKETIPDSFIFYRPRDIVSGDFYFVYPVQTSGDEGQGLSLFAAVDCTGHGVPGAFMSILGNNILKASLSEKEVNTPSQALDFLNRNIIASLSQNKIDDSVIRDGMDIALCALDRSQGKLYYAGANLPAWIIRGTELFELSPDKQPIGNYGNNDPYTTHVFEVQKGDMVYIFSDGYPDQFGGPDETVRSNGGKKFKYSQLKKLLLSIHSDEPAVQQFKLEKAILDWKGDLEQTDDMLIIGVRI